MPRCIFIIHLSPVNSQLSLVTESKDRMNGWSLFLVPKHNFQSLLSEFFTRQQYFPFPFFVDSF